VLVLCAFIASAVLPAWSQNRTEAAQTSLSEEPTAAQRERAAAQVELAARLDPLAVEPLFVAAAIAQGRDRLLDARRYLLQAADRQPDNPDVWFRVAGIALALADRPGFQRAAQKMLELDPANGTARALASRAVGQLTPPERSAAATGTPLPSVQAPVAPTLPQAPAPPG
jgi:tetratricopeptide (TPR) repeat protein